MSNGALVLKTPINLNDTTYFPYMPGMSSRSWPSAYAGIYSRQLWVYVVVNKLAKATARLPLPVYARGESGRTRVPQHPMAKLLQRPNPALSGYHLWLWTSATEDIYGQAFWYKQRTGGQVTGLYPLHPSSMRYEDGFWWFENGSTRIDRIPSSDLVHFRSFHPDSQTNGLSALEPLRSTLENEWHARNATSSFWENGARPGVALSHPATLSQPAADRLRAQWDSMHAGSGKTGSTVVLEEGMKPEVLTLSAEEAQYIETRKLNREEVCAAYDVPPPVVHILDHATFSNITEQMRSMYRDTMGGRLPGLEATIELDLRAAEWPDDDVYAEFLMDDVLRGDFEARQDALAKATHMTIAEKRTVENLPFIEGTDRIFLNTATMPLDAIDAQARALEQQAAAPAPAADNVIPMPVARSAVSQAAARSVMGRLSWQRSLGQVDVRALVEGLSDREAAGVAHAVDEERKVDGTVEGLRDRLRQISAKRATMKAADLGPHEEQMRRTLAAFFAKQAASSSNFEEGWYFVLSVYLHATAVTVSASVGKAALRSLNFDPSIYDVDRTLAFLKAVSDRLAAGINATTEAQYEAAQEDPDVEDPFAKATDSRLDGIAVGVVTLVSGFGVVEAGQRAGESEGRAPTKTWVTGSNPRPEHAALNGETVGIDEEFSNGAGWPGGDGEVGCNCSVEVGF